MTVSALSGFITGGVMNNVTGNDVKSLKEMCTSMTGSRGEELNLDNRSLTGVTRKKHFW